MMTVDTAAVVEPVGDVTAELGEGPYWVPEDDCLLWVDIEGARLHRTYFPSAETVTDSPGPISAAFPAVGGGILIAGGAALTLLFPAERGGQWVARTIADTPAREGLRFNDAGVDPAGRVWVGSMHTTEAEPVGELYRLDPGSRLNAVVKNVTVSNGLGWSPDGSRMYYADSPLRRVDVFDYDPATGEASARRPFADLSAAEGVPDGLTVDADGCVWVAMWGGSALRRFTPEGEPTPCCRSRSPSPPAAPSAARSWPTSTSPAPGTASPRTSSQRSPSRAACCTSARARSASPPPPPRPPSRPNPKPVSQGVGRPAVVRVGTTRPSHHSG
jgi:sugar lactone lactonase YvrE